jgi:asparagine synthase (glutamine-hydrolysing)
MSLLAGIFSRQSNVVVHESVCEALRKVISRYPEEHVDVFRGPRICLLKVDVGAYSQPAYHVDPSGTVTMLAGDPLLAREGQENIQDRAAALELLHRAWDQGDWSILNQARGTFCAVHYRPHPATLTLIVDKLGIRPLYYSATKYHLVFAGSLRILEAFPYLSKKMDVRAVTEIITFGYPLGERTPYSNVSVPRAAEVVHVSDDNISAQKYWHWDSVHVSDRTEPELLNDLHCRFRDAIARRLRKDTTASAFLSGGLDSRCIVATLCHLGVRVFTFNFAANGSQDQVFGAKFAKTIGTIHQEKEIDFKDPKLFEIIAASWKSSPHFATWPLEEPRLVWSGDGGSVGLGHVYLTQETVSLLRLRRVDAAIEQFFHEQGIQVSPKLLRPAMAACLERVLHEGVREELSQIHCQDPGRDFYLFLMLNNQRRHLLPFYEDIDLHRFDCQLPFYDADFIEGVMAVPLDWCLRHLFYVKWLTLFQPAVTSVEWQAYPDHEPCPIPICEGLTSQWNARPLGHKERKEHLLRQSREMLSRKDFADPILSKRNLCLARWLYSFGVRDCSGFLEAALEYHHYWNSCGGSYALPFPEREDLLR